MKELSCFLAALCLLAVPADGRVDASLQDPAFGEVIDVRVINLEAVVTDRGRRVEGLTADDFRLRIDGEEVPIEFFTEVRGGSAAAAGDTPAPALAEPGGTVGTRYLLFIDDTFALAPDRDRLLDRIAAQLTSLGPEDRMAIVAFDGRRADMLSNWTASHDELRAALEKAKRRRARGLERRAEERLYDDFKRQQRRDAAARAERAAGADDRGEAEIAEHGLDRLAPEDVERSREIASQVKRSVYGATSALRAFGQPPGRRVMLLLSGGWPASPTSWVVGSFEAAAGEAQLTRGAALFRPLVDAANLLGYTLYPIDAGRRSGDTGISAEIASWQDAEIATRLAVDRDRIEDDALVHLAAETGGLAFLDGAAGEAFARTAEDTRSYYWLGFSPSWQGDDERHRIELQVLGKSYDVRARSGFSDLSRRTEVTMRVESAQLLDQPLPGSETPLSASLGDPEPAGFRKVAVPVRLEIPLDRITFVPEDGAYAALVELRVAATDDGGDVAEIPVVPISLRAQRPPVPGESGIYETSIRLRKRPHQLLLALFDPPSGELLSTRLDFTP